MAIYTWVPVLPYIGSATTQQILNYKGQPTAYSVVLIRGQWYATGFGTYETALLGQGNLSQCKILALRAFKASH